jgi:Family of unknown function (DUF5329)
MKSAANRVIVQETRPMQVAALAIAVLAGVVAVESPQTEPEKIEALIRHVESLADAKFIRNGVEYDAKTAGQFLRGKWKTQESNVKTVQDFIDKIATQSSTTGKPYLIKLKDGREVKSGEYLAAELKKLAAADK